MMAVAYARINNDYMLKYYRRSSALRRGDVALVSRRQNTPLTELVADQSGMWAERLRKSA